MGFQCRQFYLKDDQCAMKVSTDSLLLGAWVTLPVAQQGALRILDIGTGCGILALMLAQRCAELGPEAANGMQLDAVELDADSATQAQENIAQSPWTRQIRVYQDNICNWATHQQLDKYDLVISNPPYFSLPVHTNGGEHSVHRSRQQSRTDARHQHQLSFQQLFAVGLSLLAPNGCLALVLPISEWEHAKTLAAAAGFKVSRHCLVQTKVSAPVKLVMVNFTATNAQATTAEQLCIHAPALNKKGTGLAYSDAFKALLEPFYLGTNW